MLVWLDMANSPHPMLLGPIADELERQGHAIWVTTRDHAQTLDLTRKRWPEATVVGLESPSSRAGKLRGIADRALSLRSAAATRRPDVAVSLNSYAQIAAATLARIPAVTLMDYEFQPANHLSFRLARRVVVPRAFSEDQLRHYGARRGRVRRFDGFKEELYLDETGTGQADVWEQFGAAPDQVRCLFRPPPEGAMYHRSGNDQFEILLRRAAGRPDAHVLLLPRFIEQRSSYAGIPGVVVAEQTLDGLDVLWSADVFVGAGGTMCREAALLGVPAYTVFAGQLAAVDRELIDRGLLQDLRCSSVDTSQWARRARDATQREEAERRRRAAKLRAWFAAVISDAARPAASAGSVPKLYEVVS